MVITDMEFISYQKVFTKPIAVKSSRKNDHQYVVNDKADSIYN